MVSINSTGGLFWRLNSSGNLTAYDTSGTVQAQFLAGKLSIAGNRATLVSNVPITSTTSTTEVDLGQTLQITTQVSSTVLVAVNVYGSNSIAGDGLQMTVAVKSGTVNPAGGTADTSPGATLIAQHISGAANATGNLTLVGFVTVTVGSAASLVIRTSAITGGTASFNFVTAGAFEM